MWIGGEERSGRGWLSLSSSHKPKTLTPCQALCQLLEGMFRKKEEATVLALKEIIITHMKRHIKME